MAKHSLFGVILGVGALIGWRYWNSHQVDSARSASPAYQMRLPQ
ncbi:tetratricopeptide repeat protein [Escherichia coli]